MFLAGRQGSTVSSPSVSLSLPEDEEREETEPRCSFCDAPFPNIDAWVSLIFENIVRLLIFKSVTIVNAGLKAFKGNI